MIYCINPNCSDRENNDEETSCSACSTPLYVNNRFKIKRKVLSDEVTEIHEIIDNQSSFSGSSGALKILKIFKGHDPERKKIFENEANILQSLNNESIPKTDALSDFFELRIEASNQSILCLIMQRFEGETLEEYVREFGAISQSKAIDYLQQLANILIYIHSKEHDEYLGIIHRDIKPSNIIVRPNGSLALIDFGFALKITQDYLSQLRTGEIPSVFSMFYTAPEQQERRPIIQSDYYALGKTIIFAITGKPLYEIEFHKETLQLLWKGYAKVDKPFAQVIDKLTESNPLKRPLDIESFSQLIFQTLPASINKHRLLRSKPIQFALIFASTLIIFGLFYLSKVWLSQIYLVEGNKALIENRYSDAKEKLKLSASFYPNFDAYNNLGIACNETGELDCAFQSYNNAISTNPQNWVGYYQLGNYYEDLQNPNFQKAEKQYEKAIKLGNGRATIAINNLARLLILRGDYGNAKKYLLQGLGSVKDKRTEANLMKNLGWLYTQLHQYQEAKEFLKQSIKLTPELNAAHCLLSQVYKVDGVQSDRDKEVKLCRNLNGKDILLPEVSKWRNES